LWRVGLPIRTNRLCHKPFSQLRYIITSMSFLSNYLSSSQAAAVKIDSKETVAPPSTPVLSSKDQKMLNVFKSSVRSKMRGKGGKGAFLKTKLFANIPATSGAGVAFALSTPLRPTDSAEYTAFSGLFDEIKVVSVKVWWGFDITASATLPISLLTATGYDSTYNTTPTSVQDILESDQSQLAALSVSPTGTASGSFPACVNSSGLWSMNIKIPKAAVANATAVTGGTGIVPNFPGEWMAIADSADSVGYLRHYVNNPGSSGSVSMNRIVQFNVEFRERT